jgi:hypothetical protein
VGNGVIVLQEGADDCVISGLTVYNNYDTGWLKINLQESEEKPEFHGITALWTFNKQWDPEKRIRDLWDVLAY